MIMKHGKRILAVFCAAALSLSFTACAGKKSATLKVGASPAPHAEILEAAKPLLAEQGIELEIVEFDDYVLPNTALSDGDLTRTTSSISRTSTRSTPATARTSSPQRASTANRLASIRAAPLRSRRLRTVGRSLFPTTAATKRARFICWRRTA